MGEAIFKKRGTCVTENKDVDKSALVLRINEIYHDVEGQIYHGKHPEILEDEKNTWAKLGDFIRPDGKSFHLLDVGTGTGFVPLQVGKKLRSRDVLLCADLSHKMLEACRENLDKEKLLCRMEFLKITEGKIPRADLSVDAITINAVLHHIPELGSFFQEMDRLLKPGGFLVIAHEPNAVFYRHFFLRFNSLVLSPRLLVGAVLRRMHLYEPFRRLAGRVFKGYGEENKIIKEVNRRLVAESVVRESLPYERLYELLDVHVPDLGGNRAGVGIDLLFWKKKFLLSYALDYYSTYNHICLEGRKKRHFKSYEQFLARVFPASGSTFSVVLRKPSVNEGKK